MSELAPSSPASPSHAVQASRADAIQRLLDRPVTPADLAAGTEMAARPPQSRMTRSVRVLLFRLGNETAALPAKVLRRVTPHARVSPIPHRTSGVLRGICNIRGELVLCADLRRLLGLADPEGEPGAFASDPRRMVVLGPADNSWVFEVDALMGVENVDPSTFREPPMTVGHSIGDYTVGVSEIGGRCVTILDGERILAGFKAGLA